MKPKLTTLKNGLRIVTVPIKDNPTVTVLVMVAAGTRYETASTNGLSHFLEHMCFKGTTKRPSQQISYELEAMGAVTNAYTDYDYTGYYAKGRANLFPKLLDVVSDIYLNSTFPETELEKERGVIMGEIDMIEDDPAHKVGYLLVESIFGNQPAGWSIIGPKSNIKTFTREDFIKYHKDHYVAEKTAIVVVGNVDPKTVESEVKKVFASIKTAKPISKKSISKLTGPKIVVGEKKTDQAHVMMGMRSVNLSHPDYMSLRMMAAILGQGMSCRLFVKLREEMGAGYYVSAGLSGTDDSGDFSIATGTEPKRVVEVVAAIVSELNRMKTELVPDHELAKAKEYMVGRIFMSNEATNSLAYTIGLQTMFNQPLRMPADVEKEIRKVTAADIMRVAKKYLKLDKLHFAMMGPDIDREAIEKLLK